MERFKFFYEDQIQNQKTQDYVDKHPEVTIDGQVWKFNPGIPHKRVQNANRYIRTVKKDDGTEETVSLSIADVQKKLGDYSGRGRPKKDGQTFVATTREQQLMKRLYGSEASYYAERSRNGKHGPVIAVYRSKTNVPVLKYQDGALGVANYWDDVTVDDDGNVKTMKGETISMSDDDMPQFLGKISDQVFNDFYGKDDDADEEDKKDKKQKAGDRYEQKVATNMDKWIGRDEDRPVNKNIDDITDNKEDQFYAVKDGSAKKSDILVVHDKPDDNGEFNKDKLNPGKEDKDFYIEAKKSIDSMTFNPTIRITRKNGKFIYEWAGNTADNYELNHPGKAGDAEDTYDNNQILRRSDLGKVLTECLNLSQENFLDKLFNMCSAYKKMMALQDRSIDKIDMEPEGGHVDTDDIEFPRDRLVLKDIVDELVRFVMCDKTPETWTELDKIFKQENMNKEKILQTYNRFSRTISRTNAVKTEFNEREFLGMKDEEKISLLFMLFNTQLRVVTSIIGEFKGEKGVNESSDDCEVVLYEDDPSNEATSSATLLKKIGWAISQWYRTMKKAAYMSMGRGTKRKDVGGFYIFDPDFDPLDIRKKHGDKVKIFTEALKGVKLTLNRRSIDPTDRNMKTTSFFIQAELNIEQPGGDITNILADLSPMTKDGGQNDKTKFFKEDGNDGV